MNYFATWGEAFRASFQAMWLKLIVFLPQLFGAILILIAGCIAASLLASLVRQLISYLKVDELIQRNKVAQRLEAQGHRLTISGALAWLVKWFIVIVTLITVSDILGIPQITNFLNEVARYIPNVIVAVIILAIGFVAANFIESVVVSAVGASQLPAASAGFLGTVAKWSIVVFAILAALVQLGVATSLVQILFTGLVGMLALAGGLAFGLGGRDKATRWLDRLERDISKDGNGTTFRGPTV